MEGAEYSNERESELLSIGNRFYQHPQYYYENDNNLTEFQKESILNFLKSCTSYSFLKLFQNFNNCFDKKIATKKKPYSFRNKAFLLCLSCGTKI